LDEALSDEASLSLKPSATQSVAEIESRHVETEPGPLNLRKRSALHRLANAMRHEPSRFVAHAKREMDLLAGNPFLLEFNR
jgi:hypothetical protein